MDGQRRYSTLLASERHASNAAYDLIDEGEGKQAAGGGGEQRKVQNSITRNSARARQQQQLGCCDIAGSQRLLWLQRLGGRAEPAPPNVLVDVRFTHRRHSRVKRQLCSPHGHVALFALAKDCIALMR